MAVKNNRILNYALISLFAFTLGIGYTSAAEYENYYGIEMNNQEYNNLINLGFSEDEIYYMDLQTFEENKDADATLVSKTEKYYKSIYTDLDGNSQSVEVTKEEYDNQGSLITRGTVNTEYKQMVSTISANGSKFRYKVSVSWKQMPSTKSYDIIGVGFDDDVYDIYIDSSVYFSYYHCNSDGECTTATDYYGKKKLSTGGSAVFKFPSTARALSTALYYDVSKNTSSTITSLVMCGDYSHATSSVGSSAASNHDIDQDGLLLGSSIYGAYDAIPCAPAIWQGSW